MHTARMVDFPGTLELQNTDKKLPLEDIAKSKGNKTEVAALVGKAVAEKAIKAGVETISFDRGGYLYHGRVKSLADGAREAGLKF